jgi:hypothetical protein
MSWNMGQCNIGIMADPAMPVTESQSCRFHFYYNTIVLWNRVRQIYQSGRF